MRAISSGDSAKSFSTQAQSMAAEAPVAWFVSGQLLIVDKANNCQIVLGYKKSRLNVPVALKLYNTKFFQNQLQKQI